MMRRREIACLFLDNGGVLLTDGWNRAQRHLTIKTFDLEAEDFERRHYQAADTWELGKMIVGIYIDCVVFHRQRPFTPDLFKYFILAQSQPHADIMRIISALKRRYALKVVAVSNESRELNDHRISTYHLDALIVFFVSSCIVHLRKPDSDIFELAIEVAHVPAEKVLIVDNNAFFCEVEQGLGMHNVVHLERESTCTRLESFGFLTDEAGVDLVTYGVGHGIQ